MKFFLLLSEFWRDRRGISAAELALLGGLAGGGLAMGAGGLGDAVGDTIGDGADMVSGGGGETTGDGDGSSGDSGTGDSGDGSGLGSNEFGSRIGEFSRDSSGIRVPDLNNFNDLNRVQQLFDGAIQLAGSNRVVFFGTDAEVVFIDAETGEVVENPDNFDGEVIEGTQ